MVNVDFLAEMVAVVRDMAVFADVDFQEEFAKNVCRHC